MFVWPDTSRSTAIFWNIVDRTLAFFVRFLPYRTPSLKSALKRASLQTKNVLPSRDGSRVRSRDANGSGIGTTVLIPACIKRSAVKQCQYAYRYINHPGSSTILNSTPKRIPIWRTANVCTKVLRLSRRMATFWKLNARCCYPRVSFVSLCFLAFARFSSREHLLDPRLYGFIFHQGQIARNNFQENSKGARIWRQH